MKQARMTGMFAGDVSVQTQPNILLVDQFPPTVPSQDSHDKLLGYLKAKLMAGGSARTARLTRFARIDKTISTWQVLSEEDTERKARQNLTGESQAISINLPLLDSHIDDMVAFFAGVYSPAAGDFFQMPDAETQGIGKVLVEKLNSDAKHHKYYRNLCRGLRSLLKYNIGGFKLAWKGKQFVEDQSYTDSDGRNSVESLDMYNTLWDPTIIDPAFIATEAEWAAVAYQKNHKWLVDRDLAGTLFGVSSLSADKADFGNRAGMASYFRMPPNQAGINAEDAGTTSGTSGNMDWGKYNASLSSDSLQIISGREVVEMYCWLNPDDFELTSVMGEEGQPVGKYVLWRFVIGDGIRILAADEVSRKDLDGREVVIPYFLGHLKQDDMGEAQRSIAELLQPFQTFGSFLMNAHVAGMRNNIWGITVYDPSVINMASVKTGTTAARIPSSAAGRDVRSVIQKVSGTVDTGDALAALGGLLNLTKEFFPSQALPSQIGGMDRAIQSQVQAVLQGVNRRLHMMVRVLDDDVLGPMRMQSYLNLVMSGSIQVEGLSDEIAERILGSGIAQLNREAAAQAMQQLLFAIIQSPQTASEVDVLKLMNYWSGLMNVTTDLESFRRPPPAAPEGEGAPTPEQQAALLAAAGGVPQ